MDLATLRWVRGSNRVSAHYLVGPEGTVHQLVPERLAAWHAGRSSLHGELAPSANARSIGIEITHDGTGRTPFTEAQYRALEQLVPYLARRYGVPKRMLARPSCRLPGSARCSGHRPYLHGRRCSMSNLEHVARRLIEELHGAGRVEVLADRGNTRVLSCRLRKALEKTMRSSSRWACGEGRSFLSPTR